MKRIMPQLGADIVGFATHFLLFGWLYQLFQNNPTAGGLLLLGLYLLFCFGVNFLRKLQPYPDASPHRLATLLDFRDKRTAVVLLTFFTITFAIIAQVDLNGFVDSTSALGADQFPEVHEGEVSLYFMFGPAFFWLAVTFFYLVVMITAVEETTVPATPAYYGREFAGLLFSNLLLVSYGAYLATVATQFGQAWLWSLVALIAFSVMFGVPRLLVYLKNPAMLGLVTFGLLLLTTAVGILIRS